MVTPDRTGFDTYAIHAGAQPDPVTGARVTPIHRTASYVLQDFDTSAAMFRQAAPGYVYSRIANPTVAVFEERLATLEGGVAAVATASGMAALHLAIATIAQAGDHLVASSALYGGSVNLLSFTLPRFGIQTTFVDPRDHDGMRAAIRPTTRLVLAETIANPVMTVTDIPAVAALCHHAGVPLLVDNTFATPALCRPIDHGADLVYHSATKFIGGHGSVLGGVLVDSGRFDWAADGRYPGLTEPYPGFPGMTFADEYGPAAFAARARTEGLRDFGAVMAADTAFALIQGCETLSVRMERHVRNTQIVAEHLAGHDMVDWVAYPGLDDHPDHALAQRLLPSGAGAVLSFGIVGGRAAGRTFVESLEVFSHLANIGDVRSLAIHPASTTHQRLTADQLTAAGVGEELIRLSVGLEDPADLVADLDGALRAAGRRDR